MKWYAIGKTLTPLDRAPESGAAVVLLNSDELAHETALPGLEAVLHHTPSARDAHVCKAEVRSNCLSGTLALPRGRRDGTRLCCGYLVTKDRVVLVDDGEMAEPYLKHIVKEKRLIENSVGRFLYDFFELLIAKDLHRLEEIEDRATALEERVLAGELEEFSTPMSELRKETMAWYRYYSQLDDVACELRENENGYFSDEECGLFRLFEERVIRLREESQLLREYCTQIQSLFQSEIDIRQNRIMQILTIVTTIFLPLTLLVDRESIFEIQSGKVIAPDRFGMTGMSEDELIDAATKLSMRENTVPSVIDELPYDKLIAESEAIFTATVKELSYSSPYSGGSAAVTVNKVFKGTAEKSPTGPAEENEIRMLVPQGLQVGETYLFFRTNGLAGMPTRNNSVISVESEEYAQIIEQIQ